LKWKEKWAGYLSGPFFYWVFSAFNESFFLAAISCAVAVVAAWYVRADKTEDEVDISENAAK
jgi:hypothetical protein